MTAPLDPEALGEFGLIEAIRRRARSTHPRWKLAIGDDAAVLRPRSGYDLVLTTDALSENVHFRWDWTDARSLGQKSLAVSLSDVGAMGARPIGCLLTLGLPRRSSPEAVSGFISGLLREARSADCPLVGGDTVGASAWSISITAIGEVPRGRALLRSAARPGERVVVTGSLGAAALGVRAMDDGAADATAFKRRQLRPRPPFHVGARLVRARLARAAIDLSDGLAQDASHLADSSGVALEIDLDRVPLARGLERAARSRGLDPQSLALHGGEDYELLFTLAPSAPDVARLATRLDVKLTEIGRVVRGRGVRWQRAGRPVELTPVGWDHFKRTRPSSEA